ncbi:MAG: HU family DNA-binding protein [Gammaproteobacteria bacterium]|jgi:nucleoid DNA-binding protein|nr:HU family DNA-binding protein [Gammaproteobacteria bacterium]
MAAKKKATAKSGKSAKKTLVKKTAVAAPKKMATVTVKDPLTKGGIIKAIMDMTTLAKKDVVASLDALTKIIDLHVRSRGPGKFVMPGLYKITVAKKAARPARKGINPFTGEEVVFKAKPAHKVIKIKALKKLKEMTV